MFIHEEIRDNHIHILDVTTIYLPDVINNYMHKLGTIHINILNLHIINNHINIPDIISSHIHILDVLNNHIHIPDVINNHIYILDVTTVVSCKLQ